MSITACELSNFGYHLADKINTNDYYRLCLIYFNQLLAEKNIEAACNWLAQELDYTHYPKMELLGLLPRCKELFASYLAGKNHPDKNVATQNEKNADFMVNFLEEHASGSVDLTMAHYYQREIDFVEAFKLYLECFANNDMLLSERLEAGVTLAEMIFSGNVVLYEDGNLNECDTRSREISFHHSKTLADVHIEKQDTQQQLFRTIQALEYLCGNQSEAAALLRARLDKILGDQRSAQAVVEVSTWTPSACWQFMQYYLRKNVNLLTDATFLASMQYALIGAPHPTPDVTHTTATRMAAPVISKAAALRGHGVFHKPQKKSDETAVAADTSLKPPASSTNDAEHLLKPPGKN